MVHDVALSLFMSAINVVAAHLGCVQETAVSTSKVRVVESGRILLTAEIIEWTGNRTPLQLAHFASDYRWADFVVDSLIRHDKYGLGTKTPSPPHGLWDVSDIIRQPHGLHEVLLLGEPELSLPDLTIYAMGNGMLCKFHTSIDDRESLEIVVTAVPGDGALQATSTKEARIVREHLVIRLVPGQGKKPFFMTQCKYLVSGNVIDWGWGPDWDPPSKELPDFIFLPEGERLPTITSADPKDLPTHEARAFETQWPGVRERLKDAMTTHFQQKEKASYDMLDQMRLFLLDHSDNYATYGHDSNDCLPIKTGDPENKRCLSIQVVFWRPSNRIITVYVAQTPQK